MIGATEIRDLAGRDGVRPEEIEKEYLQFAFLHSLAADVDGLVFRGGTMLRIAHQHPRYSEDLDFVRLHSPEEAEASVEAGLQDVVRWGIRAKHAEPTRGKESLIWAVNFRGPLYRTTGRENRIKIELGSTRDHDLKPEVSIVQQKYADIPAFTLPTQDRRETTAEKVRAMIERNVARDLYDLAHLVSQGFLPAETLVAKKLKWKKGENPRRIQPHARADYERDLRDWVPVRARLPWPAAWAKVRPYLKTLASVELR